ncbi:hypothetical protein SN31241_6370 [Salmonella enterica subsp. enterica serovar Newport str. USMARC-S3124.1]|nr:hypothetical protein SN31241_6370 [Salmonella enterica subsp. enterica serovar Newport str. USMARC-S3124.1]
MQKKRSLWFFLSEYFHSKKHEKTMPKVKKELTYLIKCIHP